jgi:hypothetical protein
MSLNCMLAVISFVIAILFVMFSIITFAEPPPIPQKILPMHGESEKD